MTLQSLLIRLKTAYSGERPNLVCEILLAHFLNKSRVFLHANADKKVESLLENANLAMLNNAKNTQKISAKMLEAFLLDIISRLNSGYPLEYITKKVSFYSQDFFIDEGALIPRPETEILIEYALDLIIKHNIKNIYEIGVGSGVISIMLCLLNKNISIIASDISSSALAIARHNIKLKSKQDSTLKKRLRLVRTNLLDGIKIPKHALIISNPPYIAESYAIPKNLAFEPQNALFGGKNGDEILRKIIALEADFLCCEIGYNQGYLKKYLGKYKQVRFYKDYAGFMRGFVASKV